MTIRRNDLIRLGLIRRFVREVRNICRRFSPSQLSPRFVMDRTSGNGDRGFRFAVTASQIFGVLVVVLGAVWISQYRGGFAWSANPTLEFNYHPVMMTIGLIFLYAEAILIYRVFAKYPKRIVKVMHGVIQAVSLIFSFVGLKAVLDSHNLNPKPIPNFYSLHSWLGLLTIALFVSQLLAGFAIFGWPGGSESDKRFYMDSHRFFGIGIFILACATALTGITEKTFFSLGKAYGKLPPEAFVINFYGISIVVFACLVIFIATRSNWKRPSENLPEREALLTSE